ncbi:MAG: hypothetical protein WDM76_17950 [Limisphaerales bacterium]
MKNFSLLKTGFTLLAAALLPALASAQDGKATLAISSIKPTPALAASVSKITTVTSTQADANGGGKSEAVVLDNKQELNRIIESLDSQLIDRINATRKFDIVGRSDLNDILKEQDSARPATWMPRPPRKPAN